MKRVLQYFGIASDLAFKATSTSFRVPNSLLKTLLWCERMLFKSISSSNFTVSSRLSNLNHSSQFRSSHPDVFKVVLKICSKFTGKHPHRSVFSNFGVGVLLYICCIFSKHLFIRTPLGDYFCQFNFIFCRMSLPSKFEQLSFIIITDKTNFLIIICKLQFCFTHGCNNFSCADMNSAWCWLQFTCITQKFIKCVVID